MTTAFTKVSTHSSLSSVRVKNLQFSPQDNVFGLAELDNPKWDAPIIGGSPVMGAGSKRSVMFHGSITSKNEQSFWDLIWDLPMIFLVRGGP